MSDMEKITPGHDVTEQLRSRRETLWINPDRKHLEANERVEGYWFVHMKAAQNRFMRFLPYIAAAFPETAAKKGVIESPLVPIPAMKAWLSQRGADIRGNVYLKDDARLPVAGSVKARGGIHAVLHIAEVLVQKAGKLQVTGNYKDLDSEEYREFFGQYTIQVGSTGNLGISIGRTAARMGFRVIVHMSSDAKEWKKQLLRKEGAIVKEYDGDYAAAVAAGREASAADDHSFFIDDENSEDLFFGYASAALRLKVQLGKLGIPVDSRHPLFVYIPCGVGGAPGGITFGLRQLFLDNVHCFFVEPTEAPCFTLGMTTGLQDRICVQDVGLSGRTIADGLAVSRPSGLACRLMKTLVSGSFTTADERLPEYQSSLLELEGLYLEPSACAGFRGLEASGQGDAAFEAYLESHGLKDVMDQATHVVWGTGGGLSQGDVPFDSRQ